MKKMTAEEKQARIVPAALTTVAERVQAVREATSQVKTKVRVHTDERCPTCGQPW